MEESKGFHYNICMDQSLRQASKFQELETPPLPTISKNIPGAQKNSEVQSMKMFRYQYRFSWDCVEARGQRAGQF